MIEVPEESLQFDEVEGKMRGNSLDTGDFQDDAPDNECFFQTHAGNFKSYTMSISKGNIVFIRPSSTKHKVLKYSLDSFQCVRSHMTKQVDRKSKASPVTFFCLLFVLSANQ